MRTSRFRLLDSFLEPYKTKKPPFGFNGLGELVYYRTYSRIKPDGTNEEWWETVQRVVEGTYNMQRDWIEQNSLGWSDRKGQTSAQEMYDIMWNMKFLPPGRGLWAMGSPLTEDRNLFACLNNCAFISTKALADDPSRPFCFLMDASMLGVGIGFDTLGHETVTIKGPSKAETFYQIPDSREGWVESVNKLLNSYFRGTAQVFFDYSSVRPAGLPIRGFGGVACGPEPLRELHEQIRALFDKALGTQITRTMIVDIMNMIGKCVVAGNVRRTAEMALEHDCYCTDYLDLKNYTLNPDRAAFGWASNNSVVVPLGADYSIPARHTILNGEPGYQWLENARAYSRMGDVPDYRDKRAAGVNPCGEQTLESGELCCLVETFPFRHESLEDYKRTLKFAYLYAKTVTLGKTHWPETNRITLRNRRIGCSMSGIAQFLAKWGIETFRQWCDEGYKTVRYYDDVYSEWMAIPKSIKVTSVKPSGTVSLLAGATPGMHYPESLFYIRRMRIDNKSALVPPLTEAGYKVEPCIGQEDSTVVVEIPVAIDDNVWPLSKVSMWEQLSLAAFLQRYWADNQVSCTITFKPEEADQIIPALHYFQYQLKGVSFLPRVDKGAFPQMPYEAITEEQYKKISSKLKPLNLNGIREEEVEPERFCNNDTCEIGGK